jgi:hypothetical protein
MAKYRSRPTLFAMTIELAEKGGVTPEEAKKILLEAVGEIPAEKLANLRDGQLTVIL